MAFKTGSAPCVLLRFRSFVFALVAVFFFRRSDLQASAPLVCEFTVSHDLPSREGEVDDVYNKRSI